MESFSSFDGGQNGEHNATLSLEWSHSPKYTGDSVDNGRDSEHCHSADMESTQPIEWDDLRGHEA